MTDEDRARKAQLLAIGALHVPPGTRLGVYPDRSVAGPDATGRWVFLHVGSFRVKLRLEDDPACRLRLEGEEPPFRLLLDGEECAADVRPERTGFHAPGQAFISLGDACRFGCAFCTLGRGGNPALDRDAAYWADLLVRGVRDRGADAVAVTAGVPTTVADQVELMADVVRRFHAAEPDVPVGVEPYLEDPADVDRLHDAGATEMKLNLQTADEGVFARVCPGLDRAAVWACLERAVATFGRGMVASNLIVGMGEADGDTIACMERLARMGVVANVRPLKVNDANRGSLERALGAEPAGPDPARMVRLADELDRALAAAALERDDLRTMCHACRGCDL